MSEPTFHESWTSWYNPETYEFIHKPGGEPPGPGFRLATEAEITARTRGWLRES